MPTEVRVFDAPGAGVTDSCKQLDMGAGNQTQEGPQEERMCS